MHWWCVLFVLPVLMAGALSPDVGCLNTTIVAGIHPDGGEQTRVDYSTSVVDTGLLSGHTIFSLDFHGEKVACYGHAQLVFCLLRGGRT